ncbi:MAG TPA: ATP-binding protein [Caldisericia bacterium]|nr:ATP-binding protein [Caldisericia bacterium]HPF49174.1 ATP-binding protein [Caldisericia bacterium]HPI82962.1 ATP-binding protein [Caldisericia bacterium]HPQ92189.1 ATP-binding protein [Caldisericia bacterium]HRV74713.1 ATP-binding protein [Caldisericia bacterium]
MLFVVVGAFIFRYVATNQANTTLLSERTENLEYITSQLPDSFIEKLASHLSSHRDFEKRKLQEGESLVIEPRYVDRWLEIKWQQTSSDIANKVVSSYESSSVGFINLGTSSSMKIEPISQEDSFETTWYPRQVKLKLIYPDDPDNLVNNNLGDTKWEPPVVLSYASQSYKRLDEDLAKIDRSIQVPIWLTIFIGIMLAFFMGLNLSSGVIKVKKGILSLKDDLHKPIPKISGELGEIADTANKLALGLLQSKSRSERVLDAVSTGIVVVDSDLMILDANPSSLQITGKTREDILGQDLNSLGHIGTIAHDNLKDVIRTGSIWSSGATKINAYKGQRFINMRAIAVDLGHTREAILAISDVTESVIQSLESERKASLTRLGLFTSGIAHEVRNPLTSIKGFVQLLTGKMKDKPESKYLVPIGREVNRLESLINDLLASVRQKPLERSFVNLSELVESVLEVQENDLIDKRIRIVRELDANIVANIDEKRVYQVILNIIINARDAMKDGGILTLKTHTNEEWHQIDIGDTGGGISEEDSAMIFTPFFTTKAEGTGLGLSICEQIIKAHGGVLSFSSDESGTVFSIKFPIE